MLAASSADTEHADGPLAAPTRPTGGMSYPAQRLLAANPLAAGTSRDYFPQCGEGITHRPTPPTPLGRLASPRA